MMDPTFSVASALVYFSANGAGSCAAAFSLVSNTPSAYSFPPRNTVCAPATVGRASVSSTAVMASRIKCFFMILIV